MTRKKKTGILAAVGALLTAAGTIFAFHGSGVEKTQGAVSTATVERRDMGAIVQATGIIKPKVGAEVRVGARITGKVERLFANIGDAVKRGQVLVKLEQDDLRARADQASAAYEEARVSFEKAKADLERDLPLEKEGYVTRESMDVLRHAHDVAKARLMKAKADEDYAKAQLDYATITAPISGTIASVTTQQGETVAAGLNAPTFITIIDLNKLEVNAYVDETDVGKIALGQEVSFTVDTFSDREFRGRVTAVYPRAVLQENVVNYITLINIGNAEGKLKPDMTANVTITLKKKKGVLAVPGSAVKREGGRKYVDVVGAGGALDHAEVKTGWKEGSYIEITSGLREGAVVVLNGEGGKK